MTVLCLVSVLQASEAQLLCMQHHGDLMTFESPSAFSIFFKRLVNPSRKADDGWKTVRFKGKFLDHYKMEYARRRFGARDPLPLS